MSDATRTAIGAPARGVDRAIAYLSVAASRLAQLICFALMCFITWDVVGRYVFNRPLAWSNEVSTMMFVAILFLGLGHAALEDRHVRIDILTSKLPPGVRKRWLLLVDAIGLVVLGFFTWRGFALLLDSLATDERIEASMYRFPMWIPETAIVAGLAIFSLQFAFLVYKRMRER